MSRRRRDAAIDSRGAEGVVKMCEEMAKTSVRVSSRISAIVRSSGPVGEEGRAARADAQREEADEVISPPARETERRERRERFRGEGVEEDWERLNR